MRVGMGEGACRRSDGAEGLSTYVVATQRAHRLNKYSVYVYMRNRE